MAINKTSTNPLYLAYRNAGPTFALIGPALLIWMIGICGFMLNLFVVITTYFTTSLRGTINYLMALICLAEAIHQIWHSVFFVVAISGINFIDLELATLLTLPQYFCVGINFMGMLLVALDRLLDVSREKFYNNLCRQHKKEYLFISTIIMLLFSVFMSYIVIANNKKFAGTPTTACLAEILPVNGDYQILWVFLPMLPLNLSGICYLIIGIIIQFNKSVSTKTNMRLLRSLFIILCVNIGGYVINLAIYWLLMKVDLGLDFISIWHLSFIAGALMNICAASNTPILYINSTEYRKAFKQFWARISIGKYLHSSNGAAIIHPNQFQQRQQIDISSI